MGTNLSSNPEDTTLFNLVKGMKDLDYLHKLTTTIFFTYGAQNFKELLLTNGFQDVNAFDKTNVFENATEHLKSHMSRLRNSSISNTSGSHGAPRIQILAGALPPTLNWRNKNS